MTEIFSILTVESRYCRLCVIVVFTCVETHFATLATIHRVNLPCCLINILYIKRFCVKYIVVFGVLLIFCGKRTSSA